MVLTLVLNLVSGLNLVVGVVEPVRVLGVVVVVGMVKLVGGKSYESPKTGKVTGEKRSKRSPNNNMANRKTMPLRGW